MAPDPQDLHDDIDVRGRPRRAVPPGALRPRGGAADSPVSREQAAEAVGLPVHSVKFHLDRLVEEGLLEVEFRRLTRPSGSRRRPAVQALPRARAECRVSLPARRTTSPPPSSPTPSSGWHGPRRRWTAAIDDRRDRRGRALAQGTPRPHGRAARAARRWRSCWHDTATSPRPPRRHRARALANCPFDRLARDHTDLVCGINLALVDRRRRRARVPPRADAPRASPRAVLRPSPPARLTARPDQRDHSADSGPAHRMRYAGPLVRLVCGAQPAASSDVAGAAPRGVAATVTAATTRGRARVAAAATLTTLAAVVARLAASGASPRCRRPRRSVASGASPRRRGRRHPHPRRAPGRATACRGRRSW